MDAKNIGRRSSAQDNFIGPQPVTNLTATNVGSGRAFNNGRIDLSWTNPTSGNTPTGYRIFRGGSEIATVNHPTNTYSNTGLNSATSYSYTVRAYDDYASSTDSNTATATATTVPATPSAPSASTVANTAQDSVSWSAPANGGLSITNYNWESNDSKSGNTTSTSVTVNQEAGTQQSYRVRAQNDNGYSEFSAYSGNVTTFSFTPFSFTPFSFAPFGFTPFGFTPFGFTPFGFTPFGFTPFGFTPFGFTPFGFTPFGFTPYSFSPPTKPPFGFKSVSATTLIKTTNGYVPAISLKVGDTLVSADILDQDTGNTLNQFQYNWSTKNALIDSNKETTIVGLTAYFADSVYLINNVKYTNTHYILVKRPGSLNGIQNTSNGDDLIKFMNVTEIVETDLLWSSTLQQFIGITEIQVLEQRELVVCIDVEPYDVFFVDNDILVHDSQPAEHIRQYVVEHEGEDLSQALLELYQSVVNEELTVQQAIAAVENAENTLTSADLEIAWNKVMIIQSQPWDLIETATEITKANLILRLNALELQVNGRTHRFGDAVQRAIAAVEYVENTLSSSDLIKAWNEVLLLVALPEELAESVEPTKADLINRLNALESQING